MNRVHFIEKCSSIQKLRQEFRRYVERPRWHGALWIRRRRVILDGPLEWHGAV